MTYKEAMQWMQHRNEKGPVDALGRLELHLCSLQALIVNALGGKTNPGDFMLGAKKQSRKPIDLDHIASAFTQAGVGITFTRY